MAYLGDYFALGLIAILCMFYFEDKHFPNMPSKAFAACLIFVGGSIVTGLGCSFLDFYGITPLWIRFVMRSFHLLINVAAISCFAIFLILHIFAHIYDNRHLKLGSFILLLLLGIYALFVLTNAWTGWLFYYDAAGTYQNGALHALEGIIAILQMICVYFCYLYNRKHIDRVMSKALLRTFPVVIFCIIVQYIFQDIMLNGLIMALVSLMLFLQFQGHRQGFHRLTKLNDRMRFFSDLESRISNKDQFQVLLMTLKGFSTINQIYGPKAGDEILYQFAYGLERRIPGTAAYHMNGTSFTLMLPYYDDDTARQNLHHIFSYLDNGVSYRSEQIRGKYVVAEYLVDESVTRADKLYEKLEFASSIANKQKLRYIRYTPDIGHQMHRRQYLLERMQYIDADHGYEVWFQPIYSLQDRKFTSAEALIRLREADGSIISPAELIPLCEETGRVRSVTWFVASETCRFLQAHPQLDFLTVSINVPMAQLMDPEFKQILDSILDQHHISHDRICLEFTERVILEDFESTRQNMKHMVQSGYRFYLDDFGTGYSNFNCVLQLPFSCIKLDRKLVLDSENPGHSLVPTLTKLFHEMDLLVVAEGAETESHVNALKGFGIDRIQGYYYAKPMCQQDLLEFYKEN